MAVKLSSPIIEQIGTYAASLQNQLQDYCASIRWVPPNQYHITLKFLGEAEPAKVSDLQTSLVTLCQSESPFEVTFSDAALGPSGGAPRTVWLRITQGQDALAALAEKVDFTCRRLGFSSEAHRYFPHVTLARIKNPIAREPLEGAWRQIASPVLSAQSVTHVSLVRSRLHASGSEY